tara:strand:- start:388 stop:1017 length:630 start_codon:yes stop_codon:yes gene_type:complete
MGWFSRGNTTDTGASQFGVPQNQGMGMGMGMNSYGGGMGGQAMDPTMMMMMQQQNPMMQQMANDPVIAMSRLLDLRDPIAAFLTTQTFMQVMDLVGETMNLAMKEFFANVKFKIDGDSMCLDPSSLPAALATLSPENIALTMSRVQQAAQNTMQQNQQSRMQLMNAHQMMGGQQNQQPGFFGSLLGNAIGNQMQNGNAMKAAGAMGAMI